MKALKTPRSGAPLSMHEDLDLDPVSLAGIYRHWSERRRRDSSGVPSQAESQLRAAILKLREGLTRTDSVLRPVGIPYLELPTSRDRGPVGSLRSELWRRQTLFNAGVREVVNRWPDHAHSPAAKCWLKDDVAPHIDAFPLPGRSHHSQAVLAVPLRVAKTMATTALTVKYSRDLKLVAEANRVIYRALEVLLRGEPEPAPSDLLDDLNALVKGERLPRRTEFGFLDQTRFLRQAAVAVAALLLPGEAVLDTVYQDWRTHSEATRARPRTTPPPLKLSVIAIADAATNQGNVLRASLECQPGQWEYFVQASLPSETSALPLRTLATIRRGVTGDWVAIASESLSLAPFSVEDFLRTAESSKAAIIYADHDELRRGTYARPFFKPGWSPDLFLEVNYLGGLVCVRRDVFDVWAKRLEKITPADVSRLVLDCHHQREEIARLPAVLWHRLKTADESDHQRAVIEFLKAHRPNASLQTIDGTPRVTYPVEANPKVSIIVPFRDRPDLLERLVLSIQRHERWANFELLLVSNASSNPATSRFLASVVDQRIRALEWNHPYNFQALCNHASKVATGEYLLFASSGLEWPEGGALEVMLGHCQRPEVGAVGASLRSREGRLEHAGLTVGLGGFAASPFRGTRVNPTWTAFGLPQWTRNFSAVTAECMMIRRTLFEEVDGFDTRFHAKNGDVDLCLRLGARGLLIVNTPQVSMLRASIHNDHDESHLEADAWNAYPRIAAHLRNGDPYYNPNLSIASVDCLPTLDTRSAEDLARQTLAIMLPGSLALVPMGERA